MGRLSGFKYKQITKRLRTFGFEFYKQAKGSHEIWFSENSNIAILIPKHNGDMPEGTLRAILNQARVNPSDFLEK